MEAGLIRKCVVVSAVNFSEGGPLTVLRDCLTSAALHLPSEWEIIALVHDRKLVDQTRVRIIEIPDAKRSWLRRLYHEWIGFRNLSNDLKPDLWLSLHDITPRVIARRQVVYCHNPAPFYKLRWRETWLDPKLLLFNQFYHHLYRIFINRNYCVIVQQTWLRKAFKNMFGPLTVIVAYPSVKVPASLEHHQLAESKAIFFYPALPRAFKNFEVICEAANILSIRGIFRFEIRLTLNGEENRYSKWVYKKYSSLPMLCFIGLQNLEQMAMQYREASAVIFPSKLETWGLPISEAKLYNKPLLVADKPYAHETVGTYYNVSFFPPSEAVVLANLMQSVIERRWQPSGSNGIEPTQPFARDWRELWSFITEGL